MDLLKLVHHVAHVSIGKRMVDPSTKNPSRYMKKLDSNSYKNKLEKETIRPCNLLPETNSNKKLL